VLAAAAAAVAAVGAAGEGLSRWKLWGGGEEEEEEQQRKRRRGGGRERCREGRGVTFFTICVNSRISFVACVLVCLRVGRP